MAKKKEEKIQEAVDIYRYEQAKLPKLQKGVHVIASQFGIASQYKTIINCYNGRRM